jgi:hypothetical protein
MSQRKGKDFDGQERGSAFMCFWFSWCLLSQYAACLVFHWAICIGEFPLNVSGRSTVSATHTSTGCQTHVLRWMINLQGAPTHPL